MRFCSVPDCPNKYHARGYCNKHYDKLRRFGSPYANQPIPEILLRDHEKKTWHPLYHTWTGMISRCHGNHFRYADYGGRGISVCQEWRDDFWLFVKDVGDRPEGHTLDRKNNDGNYEVGNVKWSTVAEQNANKRPSKKAEVDF